jgi:hypothetical protein
MGKKCNSGDSFSVKLKNSSSFSVDLKLCLEKTNGKWSCFASSNISPGEVEPKYWDYYVCHGSGKYKAWSRPAGDYSMQFPKP